MSMQILSKLQNQIIACKQCPRLVAWREQAAKEKVKRFSDDEYWGKPLPSFGDPRARFLIDKIFRRIRELLQD